MLKKIISSLACVMLVFTSATVLATATKATKKTTAKKVTTAKNTTTAKTTTKKPIVKPVTIKLGTLSGTITYQHQIGGGFLGGDKKTVVNGECATIFVFSKNFKCSKNSELWYTRNDPAFDFKVPVWRKNVKLDGTYKLILPIGNYTVMTLSSKAQNLNSPLSTVCPDNLKNFFYANDYELFANMLNREHKFLKTFDITIKENQTITLNYQFVSDR